MSQQHPQGPICLNPGVWLIRAAGLADAGRDVPDAAAVIEIGDSAGAGTALGVRLIAAGPRAEVEQHEAALGAIASGNTLDLPEAVLLPGLVNAHTHLDLTHIGPKGFDESLGFVGWAMMIIRSRLSEPADIRRSVQRGVDISLAGGVVAVGDIAGGLSLEPMRVCRDAGLLGVSFYEFFGLGPTEESGIGAMRALVEEHASQTDAGTGFRLGLSPHAPYTAGLGVQRAAAELQRDRNVRTSTHLAEMPAEREFLTQGTGPIKELLQTLGGWEDSITGALCKAGSPIEHMQEVLAIAPQLVAHVNDCSDTDIDTLVRTSTSVAYNPRSSWYFKNHEHFGPHRYREMLGAGVNVCLGTDSVVNIAPEQAYRLSTLDEMRFLLARDSVDPRTLIAMGTVNGARALDLDPELFTFSAGAVAGLVAVDVSGTPAGPSAARRVLSGDGPPVLIRPS